MTHNPLRGFSIGESDIRFYGRDLQRPECILTRKDGTVFTADARGVMRIESNGSQRIIGDADYRGFAEASSNAVRYGQGSLPTGTALLPSGDFIVADFGLNKFIRIKPDGTRQDFLAEIDGAPVGKANFVYLDTKGRLWLTVSIRSPSWVEAVRTGKISDGLIILVDDKGPRVVADGIDFTNEVRLDAAGDYLYCVETFGYRISRYRVGADGALSGKETFGPSRLPVHPDGIAFDNFGNLWVVAPIDEAVVAITPAGDVLRILDLGQPDKIQAYNDRSAAGELTFDHVWAAGWARNPLLTGLAFGGPDLKTVYLGSLGGTALPYFRSPVAGLAPAHWEFGS